MAILAHLTRLTNQPITSDHYKNLNSPFFKSGAILIIHAKFQLIGPEMAILAYLTNLTWNACFLNPGANTDMHTKFQPNRLRTGDFSPLKPIMTNGPTNQLNQ